MSFDSYDSRNRHDYPVEHVAPNHPVMVQAHLHLPVHLLPTYLAPVLVAVADTKIVDSPATQLWSVDFARWRNASAAHYLAVAMMLFVYYGRHNKHGRVDHDVFPSRAVMAWVFPSMSIGYYDPHNNVGQIDRICIWLKIVMVCG